MIVRTTVFAFLSAALVGQAGEQQAGSSETASPRTRAETSEWTETSTQADLVAFLDALRPLPHAGRLHRTAFAKTNEGRDLIAVVVGTGDRFDGSPSAVARAGKLRLLINANIHGGEVEGKEVAQQLLRELALGQHGDLLEHAVLIVVPNFNADGNDAIDKRNRVNQNGPTGGVGRRPNAQQLDLNRDFVKARSPEVQGMLRLFRRYDPHLFMDLHTTDGSNHGYHLTYAPSLAVNADPDLDAFVRDRLLTEVTAAVRDKHGFRIWHYGNFPRRASSASGWRTYDHRPRFGTNYYGLRNRLALLSEAFAYQPFETRAKVTYAFVIESLRGVVRHRAAVQSLCAAGDARALAGGLEFGHDSELAPAVEHSIPVDEIEWTRQPGGGRRGVSQNKIEWRKMPAQVAYRAKQRLALPAGWAIVQPSDDLRQTLLRHGLTLGLLLADVEQEVEVFVPRAAPRGRRYQGARPVTLRGEYRKETRKLPEGTLIVSAHQRLGRVAAQLLEGASEDSLATWGYFDAQISVEESGTEPTGRLHYPAVRLAKLPAERVRAVAPLEPDADGGEKVRIEMRVVGGDGEPRKLSYAIGDQEFAALADLRAELRRVAADPAAVQVVVVPAAGTTYGDVAALVDLLTAAGYENIVFGGDLKRR